MSKISTILLLSFLFIFTQSCKDPCKDIECNNGSCIEGICECDEGYGGEYCNERLSLKFTGNWSGNFDCDSQSADATILIEDDEVDLYALTLNTVGLTLSYDALTFDLDEYTMIGKINEYFTSFVIDTQKYIIDIPNTPGVSADLFGNGYFTDDNKLNLTINVKNDDFNAYFSCTGIAEK